MPHECTGCGQRFADGSKEMLAGCPSCGGNKFQFRPRVESADREDAAQAAARTEVIEEEFLPPKPAASEEPATEEEVVEEVPKKTLAQLRKELDEQFESIKIVEPGQYELNLMELYDRETYIISLQEDGKYVIDVPEARHHPRES